MKINEIYKSVSLGAPKRLVKSTCLTIISNICNVLPFGFLGYAIILLYEYYSNNILKFPNDKLWIVFCGMVISIFLMIVFQILAYRAQYRGAYEISAEGRATLAEKIRKLPMSYFSSKDSNDLGETMMGSFDMVEQAVSGILPQLVAGVLSPVIAILSFIYIDWRMALAMFIPMPLAFLILYLIKRWEEALGEKTYNARVLVGNYLQEYLEGTEVIRAYNLQGENFVRLKDSFINLMKANIKQECGLGPVYLIAVSVVKSGISIMTILGTYLLLGGTISIPKFMIFLLYCNRIFEPLSAAIIKLPEFKYDLIGAKKINRLLNEPEMPGSSNPSIDNYDIVFESVDFSYQNIPVLKNINTSFEKNKLTAVVGESGSGKSTILKLIARYYDPQKGSIKLSSFDMKDINPENLMKNFSMVFQDVYLFEDTIGNNIRYGKEGATQGDVEKAAKLANCHDFISKLPLGYNTLVGEGGATLSGGEKQRISIARALLKDAPIILLDEATASLDPENELEVQMAINNLVENRTVVMVAHKLRTISQADKIIVIKDGEIVQEGTHTELLLSDGEYKKLWDIQNKTLGWSI